jgi:hypothetical protein
MYFKYAKMIGFRWSINRSRPRTLIRENPKGGLDWIQMSHPHFRPAFLHRDYANIDAFNSFNEIPVLKHLSFIRVIYKFKYSTSLLGQLMKYKISESLFRIISARDASENDMNNEWFF